MKHKMEGRVFDMKRMGVAELFPGREVGPFCRTAIAKCGRDVLVEVELDGRLVRPALDGHEISPFWDGCDCPECLKCRTAT